MANDFGEEALAVMRKKYNARESLSEEMHQRVMDLFRRYLLVGGMPDAVNTYLATHNILKVRKIQESIRSMYGEDATGTDNEDIYF